MRKATRGQNESEFSWCKGKTGIAICKNGGFREKRRWVSGEQLSGLNSGSECLWDIQEGNQINDCRAQRCRCKSESLQQVGGPASHSPGKVSSTVTKRENRAQGLSPGHPNTSRSDSLRKTRQRRLSRSNQTCWKKSRRMWHPRIRGKTATTVPELH